MPPPGHYAKQEVQHARNPWATFRRLLGLLAGRRRDVALLLATAYVKACERDKAHNVLQALEKRYSGDPEIEALSKAYFD